MSFARFDPEPKIDCVVVLPVSDRMRMAPWKSLWIVVLRRLSTKLSNLLDLQVSKDSVVAVLAIGGSEQPEEKKYIANTDAISIQVGLGPSRLSKSAAALKKYGILVA
jgi:hypothetical protein